jgi:anti-anti-sigma regulatory factor
VAVSHTGKDLLVRVKGDGGVEWAGRILHGLLTSAARRPLSVALDLSELTSISCLAMGVLIA